MKIKSLHGNKVHIPLPNGHGLEFAPGEVKEIDDELGKKTLTSKGWEEVKELKKRVIKTPKKKEVKKEVI